MSSESVLEKLGEASKPWEARRIALPHSPGRGEDAPGGYSYITAASNEADVVLDPFCSGGTTIHAAQKPRRKWIGIDITHLAISLSKSVSRMPFPESNLKSMERLVTCLRHDSSTVGVAN
jgi:DNA methylase